MSDIISDFKRPSSELITSFAGIGSATIYEAAGRIGSVDPLIKPLGPGVKILGPALTVRCFPNENLMLHKALQLAKPGDIIVASTDHYPNAGYFGDLMATSALALKVGGLAIDGGVRDSEEIMEMGFPIFSRGTCIRGTVKRNRGLINHSIIFGGIVVNPGDMIAGDNDGIVIIPQDRIEAVLESTKKRLENEVKKAELLSSGKTSMELNKLDAVIKSLGMTEE